MINIYSKSGWSSKAKLAKCLASCRLACAFFSHIFAKYAFIKCLFT